MRMVHPPLISLELDRAIAHVVRAPRLLVACDYDGTLARIVDRPEVAAPVTAAVDALHRLATLAGTDAAVITGRSLAGLDAVSSFDARIHRVGSHGAESADAPPLLLSPAASDLLAQIVADLEAVAAQVPGSLVEHKPASATFHYRTVDDALVDSACRAVLGRAGARPGAHVQLGKRVIEIGVVRLDKGGAIDRLRELTSADAVVFIGDDVTDEQAFAVLTPSDVGVKVGPGVTAASHRVDDPSAVASALQLIADRRAGHR